MADKLNCWQVKHCGREPGGSEVDHVGICPAASDYTLNRINKGKNGGRICWAVAGTLCGGMIQGTFAQKHLNCITCAFYQKVYQEEGYNFKALDLVVNVNLR
jgi:hypothetical protein